jgi:prepilin-type processing-associated H-X9-DG protein
MNGKYAEGWSFSMYLRRFTLIELLTVITIIMILMALLMPAVHRARAQGQAAACLNNLDEMGIAMYHIIGDTGKAPSPAHFMAMTEVLGKDDAIYKCPSDDESGMSSYGANMCLAGFDTEDVNRIVAMDAHVDSLRWEGSDSETWEADVAARHFVGMNALFYDGHVERVEAASVNPYGHPEMADAVVDAVWRPLSGECSACGLLAEYWEIPNSFAGPAHTRADASLALPFGCVGGYSNCASDPIWCASVPYSFPFAIDPHPWNTDPFKSARWTGQIKAEANESYTFWAVGDNNVWVYIDGSLAFYYAFGGRRGVQTWRPSSPVAMKAGEWVDIEVRLLELGRSPSHLWVQWESASTSRGDIPSCNLRQP